MIRDLLYGNWKGDDGANNEKPSIRSLVDIMKPTGPISSPPALQTSMVI